MIVLFTDFGLQGPYVGQVKARLLAEAPGVPIVDLFSDAPARDARSAAYLLAAYMAEFPSDSVFLSVVDPGVGGDRPALVVRADGRWFVGPDNGLFELILRRARDVPRVWEISWRPERLSASFHGRDLFAPVAARLALGEPPSGEERPAEEGRHLDWPDDLARIVYIDIFGNAISGIRASVLDQDTELRVGNSRLKRVETFTRVAQGRPFWYENANGLAEIAVNMGNASEIIGLRVGSEIAIGGRGKITDSE